MAAVQIAAFGTVVVTSVLAAVILLVILFFGFKKKQERNGHSEASESEREEKPVNSKEKREKIKQTRGKRRIAQVKSHRRQCAVLKGHTEDVLDLEFSINGKYLASTSQGSDKYFCLTARNDVQRMYSYKGEIHAIWW